MAILFVGDSPSKGNKMQDIPFVGTKSYKTLLEWIYKLDVDISDVYLTNASQAIFKVYEDGVEAHIHWGTVSCIDKVVALGKNSSEKLSKQKIPHHKIDHPSGLNRKLNNKKYVENMLKECYNYLHNKEN